MMLIVGCGDYILVSSLAKTGSLSFFAYPYPSVYINGTTNATNSSSSSYPNKKNIPINNFTQLLWYTIIYNSALVVPVLILWIKLFWKVVIINDNVTE